jgi:predicted nuclease of predicted toxin-antitoxin system
LRHLFIRLYLDEDVNVLLADMLRARGFQVMTTLEAEQIGKSDGEQLAFATSREQAILTHNRVDFEALGRLYFKEAWPHSGIIIAVRRRPMELLHRVLALLNRVAADEIENQIRYI